MGLFDTLADIITEQDPEGVSVPMLMPAGTDGRHFATTGDTDLRVDAHEPAADFDFLKTIHAANERVPVSALEFGAEALFRLLQRFHDYEGAKGILAVWVALALWRGCLHALKMCQLPVRSYAPEPPTRDTSRSDGRSHRNRYPIPTPTLTTLRPTSAPVPFGHPQSALPFRHRQYHGRRSLTGRHPQQAC